MGVTLGAILAGGGLLGALGSNKAVDEAERVALQLKEYQTEINKQVANTNASINAYNETKSFGSLISQQQAMSSAMGKQTTGGSNQAIAKEGSKNLNRDIALGFEKADIFGKTQDLALQGAKEAAKASKKSRRSGLLSKGLATGSLLLS